MGINIKDFNEMELLQLKYQILEEKVSLLQSHTNPFIKPMNDEEVCEYLGVCLKTLAGYRQDGSLAYIQKKQKFWYKRADVEAFLERHYVKAQ